MIQHDNYIEFDLKGILFYILRRWKPIVLITLAVAILLGALQASLTYKNQSKNSFEKQYQAYQEGLVIYEDSVTDAEKDLAILQEYIDHSVFMQLEPYNVYIAKATYHIDSGYVILPDSPYQNTDKTKVLTQFYRNFLQDSSFYEDISIAHNIEVPYLMELIEVPDDSSAVLSLSVMHPEKEVAQEILQDIQKKLPDLHHLLETTVHEHTLTELSATCSIYINNSLKKEQDTILKDFQKLQDTLETEQKALDAFVKSNYPVQNSVPKVFVKWFILGGVLGAFLTIVYLLFKAVCANRLLSSDQLASNCKTTVLGEAICSSTTLPYIVKKFNRMQGCLTENTEYNWQYIAHNIELHCGDAKRILVCSDMDSDLSLKITTPLNALLPNLQLIPVGNPLTDITTLLSLSESNVVLMVAVRDKSQNKILKKIMNLIQEHRKDPIGFIITY